MAEEKDDLQEESTEKKKGSKTLLIIIIAVSVVLGAGGFVGFKLMAGKSDTKEEKKVVEKTTTVPLDPFVLNLADRGRYLKMTVQLELSDESYVELVNQKIPQLRDTIITLVSSKSVNSISSPEGKFQLKDEILFRANQILGGEKDIIKNLYFTEFVMQ